MNPLRTWTRIAAPGVGLVADTIDTAERLPSGMAPGPAWFIAVDAPGPVSFELRAALSYKSTLDWRSFLAGLPITNGPVIFEAGFVVTPGPPRELPRPRSVWPSTATWFHFTEDPCVVFALVQANPSAPAGEYRIHLIRGQAPASV